MVILKVTYKTLRNRFAIRFNVLLDPINALAPARTKAKPSVELSAFCFFGIVYGF